MIALKLLMVLFLTQAFARIGDDKGNGGNIVVCVDQNKKTYELLDFFEARTFEHRQLESPSDPDWFTLAKNKVAQLKSLSPLRSQYYQELLENFKGKAIFLKQGEFSSSDDAGPIQLPEHCLLAQAATQLTDSNTGEKTFYINQDLWTKLDPFQKAGLALHEIILSEGIESLQRYSVKSRWMNGLIWSQELASYNQDTFRDLLRDRIEFRYEDRSPYWVELYDEQRNPVSNLWYPNGRPWQISTRAHQRMCIGETCWVTAHPTEKEDRINLTFDSSGRITWAYTNAGRSRIWGQPIEFDEWVSFFANGEIEILQLKTGSSLKWKRGAQAIALSEKLSFYQTGELEGWMTRRSSLSLSVTPNSEMPALWDAAFPNSVSFHRNGTILSGFILEDREFLDKEGRRILKKARSRCTFNPDGTWNE